MKKFLIIVGGILVFLSIVLVAGALYALHTMEKEKNRVKTDAARQNRWKKKDAAPGPDPEEENPDPEQETVDTTFTVLKEDKTEKAA